MITILFSQAVLLMQVNKAVPRSVVDDCKRVELALADFVPKSDQTWSYSRVLSVTQASKGNLLLTFSNKADYKLSLVNSSPHNRSINGHKRGMKFNSRSQWEKWCFGLISRIWKNVDGYVLEYQATPEIATNAGGRKLWTSDSNTVTIVWKTHPVRGLYRQFSCTVDAATGAPLHLACSPLFLKAPAKLHIEFDNSKLRKTKVALPPVGETGKPKPG